MIHRISTVFKTIFELKNLEDEVETIWWQSVNWIWCKFSKPDYTPGNLKFQIPIPRKKSLSKMGNDHKG